MLNDDCTHRCLRCRTTYFDGQRQQQMKTAIVSEEAIIYRPRLTPSNNFFLHLVLVSRSLGQGTAFGAGALEPGRV